MKSTDKFLIGILIGALLLVVAAFAIALTRPKPSYQAENTPGGVVHNYLLALQRRDYARAYRALSPGIPGYPRSVDAFADAVEANHYAFNTDDSIALKVIATERHGQRATVKVQKIQFYGGLFESHQSTETFSVSLRHENSAWKIRTAERYWLPEWDGKKPYGSR